MTETQLGKILVVDDEVELKNILVETLTAQGYQATGFSSGEQAILALRDSEYDLLLTDLMMPGMDGISLVKASLAIDPHVVAIVMTGQGTIQTAVDAMKAGAFDYVLKPFRLQHFLPVLTRAMNSRHLRLENLQLRETVAIYELAHTIAFALDPQTIINKLADAALQQTDADEVSILLPSGAGDEFYVAAVRGENRQGLLGQRVSLENSISGWVARERRALVLDGEVNDERFRSLWPQPEIRSALSVPMQVANKLVGTININALHRARPFNLGQMKALTILASTAAAALESASLYTQVLTAEANYRAIFENAIEGLFQSTRDGGFTTVNPAFARILGYASPAEAIAAITDIGQQLYVDRRDYEEAARLQTEHGVLQGFEYQAYRRDGEKIWLSENRRSVRDQNGAELYCEGSVEEITKRKRIEDEERKARDQYESLVESIDGIVWQLDVPTFMFTFVSSQAERLCGYPIQQWLTEPNFWVEHLHPDDRWAVDYCAEAAALGVDHEFDYRMIAADGRVVWLRDMVTVDNSDPECQRLRGVMVDITRRKQAEQALIESEGRKDAILKSALDCVLTMDHEGKILEFNPAAVDTFGYTSEEVVGQSMTELIVPAGLKANQPAGLTRFLTTERSSVLGKRMEVTARRADGAKIPVELTITSTGELPRPTFTAFIRDLTERKRTEDELRKSEERYREVVENARDIIYEHDLEGNYTSVNRAGEQVTGYSLAETLKLNMSQTIAPEFLEKARQMLKRKLAGEIATAYELDLIARDGRRIAVEVNSRLVFQKGVPVGVQGIARDVTERQQLEEQLRQSQKLEAVGQLAGGVAHDFNNLLTVIGGYSDLVLRRLPERSPLLVSVAEIKKAADRASALTRQLLAFSRKQILQPTVLDLNSTVTNLEKMLRRLIGEDIDLLTITAPDLGQVKADPGQLDQVIINLIVNARDAMPAGGKLTIQTENVQLSEEYSQNHVPCMPGNYIMLAVSDTGTGMDAETQSRIFEPFFTTKSAGKGTGLGLSTAYGIVKQSSGNIWVYSEVGKGTTFKIYLPRVDEAAEIDATGKVTRPTPHGTETILLVEDEEQVRQIAQRILTDLGYDVLEATNGQEALTVAQQHDGNIDLTITDVVMPQLSGRELIERLGPLRPEMKVLYMSGYTDDAIVRHGLLDEQLEFIQKPFAADAFARKIRSVLDTPVERA